MSFGRKLNALVFLLPLVLEAGCTTFQWQTEGFRQPSNEVSPQASASSVPFQPPISWPVEKVRLSQEFKTGSSGRHFGIDLTGRRGSPVFAAHDGWVIYVGSDFHGYGRLIMVDNGKGWTSLYSHLDQAVVKEGAQIKRGQRIGLMGQTGNATGVHLHFELRKDKHPVNPLAYLP